MSCVVRMVFARPLLFRNVAFLLPCNLGVSQTRILEKVSIHKTE